MNKSRGITTDREMADLKNTYFDKLDNALSADSNIIVFSGEDLSLLNEQETLNMKDYFEKFFDQEIIFEIIACVRNPLSYFTSATQEIVKAGNSLNVATDYINKLSGKLFFFSINKYINCFGKENVRVYKFEDAIRYTYGIIGKFCELLNIKISGPSDLKNNLSLSHEAIDILNKINQVNANYTVNRSDKHEVYSNLDVILSLRGSKFCLSSEMSGHSIESSSKDCDWLSASFNLNYSTALLDDKYTHWTSEYIFLLDQCINELDVKYKNLMIECLRDIAVDYEKHNLKRSYEIMKLAQKHRPHGPFISKKIEQYSLEIKSI